tara:strand:- start:89 stop:742 length:654 start_codon:yes stop_codon:yes gene_type:complete
MNKITFLLFLIILFTIKGYAQINAVTEQGDTIVVYDNGTWKNKKTIINTQLLESNVEATVEIDDFSNKKSIRTENWVSFALSSTKSRLSGYASYYNDGIFSVTLTLGSDLGCMSQQRSTLKVKLSNEEIIEFIQVSKTDCGNTVVASFAPITQPDLKNENYKDLIRQNVETLIENDWVTMRMQGTEYYTDITPRETRKVPKPEQFFRQHFLAIKNKL